MRLSVIIVSYNVYPFLDNCLRSVGQAMQGIDGEVIVVDNASVDRTPQLLYEHFPDVKVIANPDNQGFAKANNQALRISQGDYVVLLNPDTIVSENTFRECLHFMDTNIEAGAVGVRMIDGSGRFLPESKRGLPTLVASFMKMTGLYRIFSSSAKLNRYYQGHVKENQIAPIEVLCGAFMFLRKSTLDQTGLLDEDFFMYGEDIDLSYRITQTGHPIYYLPSTTIIHYKGESTRKSTINYILTFYEAMLIFTKKHPEFKGQQSLIRIAIYLHGLMQLIRQFVVRIWPVFLDAVLLFGSFYVVSQLWANYFYHSPGYFRESYYYLNIPLYTLIAIASFYLNGAYDKPYTKKSSWLGLGWSIIGILVIYAMLPAHMRNSRMVILLGSFLYMMFMILTRWKLPPWNVSSREFLHQEPRKAIIVAKLDEAVRIRELINRSRDLIEITGTVSPEVDASLVNASYIGQLNQLSEIVRVHNVKEIIFSAQDVPFSIFTSSMTLLGPGMRYMLAAATSMNIVGSMSSETEGESYAIRIDFKLAHPASLRAKRLFDLASSFVMILISPILFLSIHPNRSLFRNIIQLITGKRTWVSYHPSDNLIKTLPFLKPGILSPAYPEDEMKPTKRLEHIHYVYARDYHWTTDLAILGAQWRRIGQKPLPYAK